MRPLKLVVEGLRSYRARRVVDFSDKQLLAIVGDTGAGKSSLLEAITYALYGGATWTNHHGDLISDGARTMIVEFTFLVDGRRWRVTRSSSRGGYPIPVHKLIGLDDEIQINGRDEVDTKIEKLVGLDYTAFLRSVVLPQGRFAQLLQASPAERNKILRRIFRVDELDLVRSLAQTTCARMEPLLARLEERRAGMLADPAGAATAAQAAVDQAEAGKKNLDALSAQFTDLATTAGWARENAHALTASGQQLIEILDEDLSGQARGLIETKTTLAERHRSLTEERSDVERELKQLQARLDKAEEAGRGIASMSRACAVTEQIAEALPQLANGLRDVADTRTEIDKLADKQQQLTLTAKELAGQVEMAREGIGELEAATSRTRDKLQQARELLATCRNVARDTQTRSCDLQTARDEVVTLIEKAGEAAQLEAQTLSACDGAHEALHAAVRANAAAAAASDLHPGDDCPVCNRTLPNGFTHPQTAELDGAHLAARLADEAHAAARAERLNLDGLVKQSTTRIEALTTELDAFARQLDEQTAALATHLGVRVDTVDLTADETTLLSAQMSLVTEHEGLLSAARSDFGELQQQTTAAATEAQTLTRQIKRDEASLARQIDELTKRIDAVRGQSASLVDGLRPQLPPVPDSGVLSLDPTTLDTIDVAALHQAAKDELASLNKIAAATQPRSSRRSEIDRELDELAGELQARVTQPLATLSSRCAVLDERVQHARHLLKCHDWQLTVVDISDPDTAVTALTDQRDRAREVADAITAAVGVAEQAAATADTQRDQLFTEHGLDSIDALERERTDANTNIELNRRVLTEAQRQEPIAADLDKRIGDAKPLLGTLTTLAGLLTDGKFVGYVIGRRQQALLGVATQLLGEMTGERFGFSADFDIVDQVTGQARSTKTLSGGETFLASLALALAMVEIASRSGRRLDALFLDEGFGALDASSLHAAIDALEMRAASGRLVAIISHVRAVAERIGDVLAVTSSPEGSKVNWLTGREREEEASNYASSVTAGLLA